MSEASPIESSFANAQVRLVVDHRTLAGQILDRATGNGWRFAVLDHLRASRRGEAGGDEVPCRLISVADAARGAGGIEAEVALGEHRYALTIWLEADAADVVFELEPRAEPAPIAAVLFPGPLVPVAGTVTQLVLPKMLTNGIAHRPTITDHWAQTLNVASHSGLNMPFWGLEAESGALIAILETADDVALTLEKSVRRPLEVATRWTASLGTIRYARRLRVRLVGSGGYVGIAKAYRAYVAARGRFKTLAEKIAERPRAKQVVGGPYFSLGYLPFSERKFRQVVSGLREIGYTNGMIGPIDF